MNNPTEGRFTVSITVNELMHQRLRALREINEESQADIVRRAIREYLELHSKDADKYIEESRGGK